RASCIRRTLPWRSRSPASRARIASTRSSLAIPPVSPCPLPTAPVIDRNSNRFARGRRRYDRRGTADTSVGLAEALDGDGERDEAEDGQDHQLQEDGDVPAGPGEAGVDGPQGLRRQVQVR